MAWRQTLTTRKSEAIRRGTQIYAEGRRWRCLYLRTSASSADNRSFADLTTTLLFREFLSGPAISRGPVWTMRTNFAFGIIRALLMRTADDARAHDDGLGPVFLNEGEDLICRGVIVPKIGGFRGPCAKLSDRIFVVDNNSNGYLRSA